ncbi:zinc-ribbon domain-containing protein [Draconibacterium sp.]|uniref:zinc ribbon domain-containing protein n=1 Tax=Draconibacterium sp. TaxID=1965318 RepID=UPI00356520DF
MPFCSNCGKEITDGARFCGSCGTSLKGENAVSSPEPKTEEPKYTKEGRKIITGGPKPPLNKQAAYQPPPQNRQKNKRGCLGCLLKSILILIVLLIGLVAALYYTTDWWNEYKGETFSEQTNERPLKSTTKKQTVKVTKAKALQSLYNEKVNTDSTHAIIKAADNLTVVLPAGMFDGEEQLEIKKLEAVTLPNGKTASEVLDITLGDMHELDDVIEIQYDVPPGFNPKQHFAQCFSPSGKEWKQVLCYYDPGIRKIRAYTNHLSMFAFTFQTIKLAHDPLMTVADESYKLWGRLTSTSQVQILEGYDPAKVMQQQSDDYLAACWGSALELYGLEAAGLSFAENVLDMSQLSDFNNMVGNLGYGLALVNSVMDAQKGNKEKAVLETLKNTYNFAAGKIINTRALNIAFIGVFAIDYALTTFANEAIAGRTRLYRAVFDNFNYYQRTQGGKKLRWWKKEIYWRMEDAKDASKFEEIVEQVIQEYIQDFWDSSFDRAIIQAELQKHGWTFDAGINAKMKDDLNKEFRVYILQYIQPVVERLHQNYLYRAREEMQENASNLAKMLNTQYKIKCTLDLEDEEDAKNYKGFKVAFSVAEKEIEKLWEGFLNEEAQMDFPCTYAGFIDAGMPAKATLFIPVNEEEDEFEEVKQSFKFQAKNGTVPVIIQMKKELADGPWQISEHEASELYNFMNEIANLTLGDAEAKKQAEERNAAKRISAVRKLEEEYKRSIQLGAVNAPSAEYEPGEDLIYLKQYNPQKEGNVYTFNIVEEDCTTRVILDLKSEKYFEAKLFTVCKGFVWIDYMKGNLKK